MFQAKAPVPLAARIGWAACVVAMLLGGGCWGRGPSRVLPPPIDPSSAGSQALAKYDANGDAKIAGAELDKAPALKAALAQIDATGDGAITADEISARVKSWQDSRVGRMGTQIRVLRNGKPLADATVTLVPEEFLGSGLERAVGRTDEMGAAFVSVPTTGPDDVTGVPPGFYRVEITKGSEIPAKYNTATTLGQEIAQDAAKIQEGFEYDLQY